MGAVATVLDAQGVTKAFAGIVALDDVSLQVEAGERVGLIGPNGAGKTTFFNCSLGLLRPDRGRVQLGGQDISGLPVHARARLGIGRTFQRIELFTESTVREHLLIAERTRRGDGRLGKVGRALMTDPKLLLLDEPSSGLDRDETAHLARTLREVQSEKGFAILLVEHDVELVSSFTERAYVLDFGCLIASGRTPDVMASDEVRAAYFGDVEVAS